MALREIALTFLVLGGGLVFLGPAASQSIQGLTASPPDPNADAVLNAVLPTLDFAGKAGRLDYNAICRGKGFESVLFPRVFVQPPSNGTTGVIAVHEIFRNDNTVVVTEGPPGIIKIRIGKMPDEILQTKLSLLTLTPEEQYNGGIAFGALGRNEDFKAAMDQLGIRPVPVLSDYSLNPTLPTLPHLPSSMRNVTVEQAVEAIARTFKGIVLYGVYSGSHEFDFKFVPLDVISKAPNAETNPG